MTYYYLSGMAGTIQNALNLPLQKVSDWYEDAFSNSYAGVGEKVAKGVAATFLLLSAIPLRAVGAVVNLAFREKIPSEVYDKESKKWQSILPPECSPHTIRQLIQAKVTSTSYKQIIIRTYYPGSNPSNVFCADGPYSDRFKDLQASRPGDFLIIALPMSRSSRFNGDNFLAKVEATGCTNDIPSGKEDVKSLKWKNILVQVHDRDQRADLQKVHALYLNSPQWLEEPAQRARVIEVLSSALQ